MIKRILIGAAATLAVVVVVLALNLFGLAPDDVFAPSNGGSGRFETPFGSGSMAWEFRHSGLFKPLLLMHILSVPAAWHLFRRAGYSGWFGLAMLIPLANVLLLYFLAFAEWPTKRGGDAGRGSGACDGIVPKVEEVRIQEKAADH